MNYALLFTVRHNRQYRSNVTVTTPTAVGPKIDTYNRTNDVIGVGLNFAW